MALMRLAAHPAATPALLAAIAGTLPARSDSPLVEVLLAHPNTPRDVLDLLLEPQAWPARPELAKIRAAAGRGGDLPRVARGFLALDHHRSLAIHALWGVTGKQADALIARAAADPATRNAILPALLDAAATSNERAQQLARVLAADPQPQPAARTWLASLLERRCGPSGADLARELATATPSPEVAAVLLETARHVEWRAHTVSLAAAEAAADGTPAAWRSALRSHPDRDGALSRAALATDPTDRGLLAAITMHAAVPLRERRAAALRLRQVSADAGVPWLPTSLSLEDLTDGADEAFLLALSDGTRAVDEPSRLTEVNALLVNRRTPGRALERCLDVLERWRNRFQPAFALTLTQLATHPNATPAVHDAVRVWDQRARSDAWGHWAELLDLTVGNDPATSRSHLPARSLGWDIDTLPGVLAWVDASLTEHLPHVTSTAQAGALIHLHQEFTGTLNELFTVAAAVTR